MPSLENFRLVVFRAVAERLSFRKAGEDLYLTQPAVSLQIKALEEDVGVQLFDRMGRQIALTPAGVLLLDYAQQVRGLLDQAERQIAALNGEHAGELALGASTTIAQYVLPRLLAEFRREHPRIHLTLISGNTEQIVGAAEEQRIAMGLIEGPEGSRNVATEAFLEDELVLIASTAHEWTERTSIACSEIATVPLLMRERGSGTRQVIEMALERRGIQQNDLQIVMELDSTEAIKSAVEAGLGVGFVSRWALAQDLRLGSAFKIVEIEALRIRRNFSLTSAKGSVSNQLVQKFRRFLFARAGANRVSTQPRRTEPSLTDKKL